MLLRGEKRRKGSGKNDEDLLSSSSLQLSSVNVFYDSGLAFQQEGLDDEKEEIEDNDNVDNLQLDDRYNATTTMTTMTAMRTSHPPSLADILREKRDEARKLSSRGADDYTDVDMTMVSNDIDCVSDGQWF